MNFSYWFAFVNLAAIGLGGSVYYVAVTGDDSAIGSADAPFRTLMRGVEAAGPGDTVLVRDGTYDHVNAVSGGDDSSVNASPVIFNHSGTPSAWITVQAEHKWRAILDCEFLCDSYIDLLNGSFIVIQDFVFTRGYKEGIHSNDAAHHISLRRNRIEFIANRPSSTNFGLDGMYTNPNCHDFIIDGNIFHDIGRTDVSWLDHGLYLRGSNFTIINNIFYNISSGWAIQMADGLNNVLVANNTFAFDKGGRGQIMLWNTLSHITIENNIFYGPVWRALATYQASITSCRVDHNIVFGADAVFLDNTGCTLSNNLIGADPGFVNANLPPYDFHLRAGGAGIDAGTEVPGLSSDFDGVARPQGAATDIGAFEYGVLSKNSNGGAASLSACGKYLTVDGHCRRIAILPWFAGMPGQWETDLELSPGSNAIQFGYITSQAFAYDGVGHNLLLEDYRGSFNAGSVYDLTGGTYSARILAGVDCYGQLLGCQTVASLGSLGLTIDGSNAAALEGAQIRETCKLLARDGSIAGQMDAPVIFRDQASARWSADLLETPLSQQTHAGATVTAFAVVNLSLSQQAVVVKVFDQSGNVVASAKTPVLNGAPSLGAAFDSVASVGGVYAAVLSNLLGIDLAPSPGSANFQGTVTFEGEAGGKIAPQVIQGSWPPIASVLVTAE